MFCEILSSAVIDHIFIFFFSKLIMLLAFETAFHVLLSVKTDIPELLTWLYVIQLERVASPFMFLFSGGFFVVVFCCFFLVLVAFPPPP